MSTHRKRIISAEYEQNDYLQAIMIRWSYSL